MTEKNFVSFFPNTKVDYIKVSQKHYKDLESAIDDKKNYSTSDILFTDYDNSGQGALACYFDPRGIIESTTKFSLYRKSPEQKYWSHVCDLDEGNLNVIDYNIVNNQYYTYFLLVTYEEYDESQSLLNKYIIGKYDLDEIGDTKYIKTKANSWTLYDVEETDQEGVYLKIGRTWNLGLGLSDENVTHNNNITTWDTLGKYPRIAHGTADYDSMSFTGLLGNIFCYEDYYMVDKDGNRTNYGTLTNIKGDSRNNYTEREEELFYDDDKQKTIKGYTWRVSNPWSTENQKLLMWKDFISNGNLKLLKDLKGNAWIIDIAESSSYKINTQSPLQQTEITFSWKEVANINDVNVVKLGKFGE